MDWKEFYLKHLEVFTPSWKIIAESMSIPIENVNVAPGPDYKEFVFCDDVSCKCKQLLQILQTDKNYENYTVTVSNGRRVLERAKFCDAPNCKCMQFVPNALVSNEPKNMHGKDECRTQDLNDVDEIKNGKRDQYSRDKIDSQVRKTPEASSHSSNGARWSETAREVRNEEQQKCKIENGQSMRTSIPGIDSEDNWIDIDDYQSIAETKMLRIQNTQSSEIKVLTECIKEMQAELNKRDELLLYKKRRQDMKIEFLEKELFGCVEKIKEQSTLLDFLEKEQQRNKDLWERKMAMLQQNIDNLLFDKSEAEDQNKKLMHEIKMMKEELRMYKDEAAKRTDLTSMTRVRDSGVQTEISIAETERHVSSFFASSTASFVDTSSLLSLDSTLRSTDYATYRDLLFEKIEKESEKLKKDYEKLKNKLLRDVKMQKSIYVSTGRDDGTTENRNEGTFDRQNTAMEYRTTIRDDGNKYNADHQKWMEDFSHKNKYHYETSIIKSGGENDTDIREHIHDFTGKIHSGITNVNKYVFKQDSTMDKETDEKSKYLTKENEDVIFSPNNQVFNNIWKFGDSIDVVQQSPDSQVLIKGIGKHSVEDQVEELSYGINSKTTRTLVADQREYEMKEHKEENKPFVESSYNPNEDPFDMAFMYQENEEIRYNDLGEELLEVLEKEKLAAQLQMSPPHEENNEMGITVQQKIASEKENAQCSEVKSPSTSFKGKGKPITDEAPQNKEANTSSILKSPVRERKFLSNSNQKSVSFKKDLTEIKFIERRNCQSQNIPKTRFLKNKGTDENEKTRTQEEKCINVLSDVFVFDEEDKIISLGHEDNDKSEESNMDKNYAKTTNSSKQFTDKNSPFIDSSSQNVKSNLNEYSTPLENTGNISMGTENKFSDEDSTESEAYDQHFVSKQRNTLGIPEGRNFAAKPIKYPKKGEVDHTSNKMDEIDEQLTDNDVSDLEMDEDPLNSNSEKQKGITSATENPINENVTAIDFEQCTHVNGNMYSAPVVENVPSLQDEVETDQHVTDSDVTPLETSGQFLDTRYGKTTHPMNYPMEKTEKMPIEEKVQKSHLKSEIQDGYFEIKNDSMKSDNVSKEFIKEAELRFASRTKEIEDLFSVCNTDHTLQNNEQTNSATLQKNEKESRPSFTKRISIIFKKNRNQRSPTTKDSTKRKETTRDEEGTKGVTKFDSQENSTRQASKNNKYLKKTTPQKEPDTNFSLSKLETTSNKSGVTIIPCPQSTSNYNPNICEISHETKESRPTGLKKKISGFLKSRKHDTIRDEKRSVVEGNQNKFKTQKEGRNLPQLVKKKDPPMLKTSKKEKDKRKEEAKQIDREMKYLVEQTKLEFQKRKANKMGQEIKVEKKKSGVENFLGRFKRKGTK